MRIPCLLLALASVSASAADRVRLTVLHTNDIHGWIMSRAAYWDAKDPKRRIGGFPALANAIVALAPAGEKFLLLDAGDWFQGTPEGSLTKGKAVVELFNELGYDAVTVGNHEYDIGEAALKELVGAARMPVLGANVRDSGSGKRVPYLKGHVVKKVGGLKVGIFGLTTSNMRRLSFPRNIAGLEFEDEIPAARREVAALRSEGAQVVIALNHVGLSREGDEESVDDRKIAAAVPGIDLIVGGHSHTALDKPLRDAANGTAIVQAGAYLTKVGKAVLEYDPKAGKVVSAESSLRDLWIDELGEDSKALAVVRRYEGEVGKALDVAIATASETLRRDREQESALGDWMADCERRWTKTQVAFQNSGGIRADLLQGPVTLRALFQIMPFDNYLVTMNLTGRQLREVLEKGVGGRAGILQVSGLTLSYAAGAPPGARLREVAVGGAPLRDDAVYSASALDFMVEGGDGYGTLGKGEDVARSETLMRDALGWCARGHSPISAPPAGRILRR